MWEYFLNLFYVYAVGCAFVSACFGVEWAMMWWDKRTEWRDPVNEHAEKPNPL